MRRLILTALSLSFAALIFANDALAQATHPKKNDPDTNRFARGFWRVVNSKDDSFVKGSHGHEEAYDFLAVIFGAPGLPGSNPLSQAENIAHIFFPTPWINDPLLYQKGLDILRDGTASEYLRYRQRLGQAVKEADSYIKRWEARESKRWDKQIVAETLYFQQRHAVPTEIGSAIDRRFSAQDALDRLPAHYIPGFALIWEDGTVVADPDPFIRSQLVRQGGVLLNLAGGPGNGAD